MRKSIILNILLLLMVAITLVNCGPKSTTTDDEKLSSASKAWIPFDGTENVTFEFDTNKIVFTGQGKDTYFENLRYMTDQSGFFTVQEDFYANFERQFLKFEAPSFHYFFTYYLEKSKGESGSWEILTVTLSDGDLYENILRIVIDETDNFDKGENFSYKNAITINGQTFDSVYFWKQSQRPFELYYTKRQGVVGFKVDTNEPWALSADTTQVK
ncbi:MAG: hypothetical protein K9G76_05480 [Bacteroidales bacterium]|nr:hypothetical protein [Bacteroidales bacterium]MCF8403131.1 hypothetical protein [Bacteroidales bacterium]